MRHVRIAICALVLVGCSEIMNDEGLVQPTTIDSTKISPPTETAPLRATTPSITETNTQPIATDQPLTDTATSLAPRPLSTSPSGSHVNRFPPVENYSWRLVASGLLKPVGVTHSGEGIDRLFVIEQAGIVRIVQDGVVLPDPFLDIRDRVGSQGFEQGLLGLAFHPQFPQNRGFYVNYTAANGDTIIARYYLTADDPLHASPGSENILLRISQPYNNHNGGAIAFGADGYLYMGLGDGGSAGDPLGNGQSLDTLLGKILRIDVDHGSLYAIPSDNPFVDSGVLPEIWAYGLRNPWRFAFDRLTGDLYIGDVGQNDWEEIDFIPANSKGGLNFGWNYFEGLHIYQGTPPPNLDLVRPIAEYNHQLGCSVTGGVVYRGSLLPEWNGIYFYGDYCSGRVWGLLRLPNGEWTTEILFENMGSISSFGEDAVGEVYLVNHEGSIFILGKE